MSGVIPVDLSQFSDWLALARQGDASARNHLFETCRSYVAVVARFQLNRRLQAKVDPSDLVQQSLLEAHRGFAEFHGGTPAEWLAWLKTIVQHNAIDVDKHFHGAALRDVRRERAITGMDSGSNPFEYPLVDPRPSPSQLLSTVERELRLATAIEGLPDDYRHVILLRNIERLPFDQVANRMNRTRGACQMLWARAIEHLRAQLISEASTEQKGIDRASQ